MGSPESDCPASPNGHNYRQNSKGEWRCANCGAAM